jgi:hypothetical protein
MYRCVNCNKNLSNEHDYLWQGSVSDHFGPDPDQSLKNKLDSDLIVVKGIVSRGE